MTPCLRLITHTGVSHHLDYLSSAFHTLFAKSCFATADISERFSPVCFPVDYLDCLFSSDRLLPALLTLPALWIYSILCLPPAPIFCIDSVYESALPTLLLILLIELCLSDFCFVLIKLHMDPNVTDPSLQKTSPEIDPAVFYHFTTEVSAQASALASHQQQLYRLTSLTEEFARLCKLSNSRHPR